MTDLHSVCWLTIAAARESLEIVAFPSKRMDEICVELA
jgi:hypothetical protein